VSEVRNMLSETDLTEDIQMHTSALVVGGGWTGIKVASELASTGYSVVLIDRGAGIGSQTSSDHLTASTQEQFSSLLDKVKKDERVEVLDATSLASLTGVPGNFQTLALSWSHLRIVGPPWWKNTGWSPGKRY